MEWLDTLFGTGPSLNTAQECARTAVVFVYGLAAVRIAGRRVFGKWSALDIIVSVIIGSNLSRTITGSAALWGTLVATTLLLLVHWLLARVAAHSERWSSLFEGEGIVLARDGKPEGGRMVQEAISQADLREALRSQGVEEVERTRLVTLEPSGKITVLKDS